MKNLSFHDFNLKFKNGLFIKNIFNKEVLTFGNFLDESIIDTISQNKTEIFSNLDVRSFMETNYHSFILSDKGLMDIINYYHKKIREVKNEDFKKLCKMAKGELTSQESNGVLMNAKYNKIEWDLSQPYSFEKENIVDSFNIEYLVFELVLILKNFDFNKNVLVFYRY